MAGVNRDDGFSLIELMLAIIVISALVAAMAHILLIGMDSYRIIVDRREALQGARLAINMMTNELQTIEVPSTDISSISPTAITFAPAGGGSVTYQVIGSNLMRGASILVGNVADGTGFTYYTSGGAVTADPAQVHRIRITVVIDMEDGDFGTLTARSDVYLRNRYYDSFTKL